MKLSSRNWYILLGLLLSIFVSACSIPQKDTLENQDMENEIQTNVSKKDAEITFVEKEENSDSQSDDAPTNHLVYREYEIGTEHSSGDVIGIDTKKLLKVVSNPVVIVVFYNDEILREIPWVKGTEEPENETSGETLNYFEITLEKTGHYGFYAKDEAGELHNIGSACMNIHKSLSYFWPLE